MNNSEKHTETSSNDNQTESEERWVIPTAVYSAEEKARLDDIYAEWEKAELAHQAFEKEMSSRLMEVWNDQIRRTSKKKNLELEDALHRSWADRITMLLKRDDLAFLEGSGFIRPS